MIISYTRSVGHASTLTQSRGHACSQITLQITIYVATIRRRRKRAQITGNTKVAVVSFPNRFFRLCW